MELGIYTFAERTPDPETGETVGPAQRLRDVVEIELADQVGLDVFGLGEHHRPDFASSSPAVVLAAAATRTTRIRLTSATFDVAGGVLVEPRVVVVGPPTDL